VEIARSDADSRSVNRNRQYYIALVSAGGFFAAISRVVSHLNWRAQTRAHDNIRELNYYVPEESDGRLCPDFHGIWLQMKQEYHDANGFRNYMALQWGKLDCWYA